MARPRRRRRLSTPLALLAGFALGLAMLGVLRDAVAVGGVVVLAGLGVAELRRARPRRRRPAAVVRPYCPNRGCPSCYPSATPNAAPAAGAAPAAPAQPYGYDSAGLPLARCPVTFGRLRCTWTEDHLGAHRNGHYGWGGDGPPSMATIKAAGLAGPALADALRANLSARGGRLSQRIDPPSGNAGGAP